MNREVQLTELICKRLQEMSAEGETQPREIPGMGDLYQVHHHRNREYFGAKLGWCFMAFSDAEAILRIRKYLLKHARDDFSRPIDILDSLVDALLKYYGDVTDINVLTNMVIKQLLTKSNFWISKTVMVLR